MPGRHRTFRIPDEVWSPAISRARAEGTTVTAEVIKFLIRYSKGSRHGGASGTRGES